MEQFPIYWCAINKKLWKKPHTRLQCPSWITTWHYSVAGEIIWRNWFDNPKAQRAAHPGIIAWPQSMTGMWLKVAWPQGDILLVWPQPQSLYPHAICSYLRVGSVAHWLKLVSDNCHIYSFILVHLRCVQLESPEISCVVNCEGVLPRTEQRWKMKILLVFPLLPSPEKLVSISPESNKKLLNGKFP